MLSSINDTDIRDNNGSKAEYLHKLKKAGFNVPYAFFVSSDIFTETFAEIQQHISDRLSVLDKDNIRSVCADISALTEKISLSPQICGEIEKRIKKDSLYAVRSSCLKEDLPMNSFAGLYDSYLNVSGTEDIVHNILKCYRSVFSEKSLSYIIDNEVSFSDLKMAVIIQDMADGSYSGIAFTVDPAGGTDTEIVIEYAEGSCENIVSGKVVPYRYVYDWYDGKVSQTSDEQPFTGGKLKEFALVFLDIQRKFGFPCDIEFTVKEDELFILQTRPVTKINYSSVTDQWTTADFKDGGVSAGVCTPFMWSLYEYIWEYTLRKFLIDSKILSVRELRKLSAMFFCRPYWNLSAVKTAMAKVPGYKESDFDKSLGISPSYEGDGVRTKFSPASVFRIAAIALSQKKILREQEAVRDEKKASLLKKYNEYLALAEKDFSFEELSELWYRLTFQDYLESESTYFWQIFINTIHQTLYKDKLIRYLSESEYLSLLSGLENVSHLLPFYSIWDTSRKIRNCSESFSFWHSSSTEEILGQLSSSDSFFLPEVRVFLSEYQYHSDKELDVSYPCYDETPQRVIGFFKEAAELDDSFDPEIEKTRKREANAQILRSLKKSSGEKKFAKLSAAAEKMREMLWWREEFRDVSTRFYFIIRLFTLKLAGRMTEKGILENSEDIWFLELEDLWAFLDGTAEASELRETAEKNRIYYDSFSEYENDNEITGNSAEFAVPSPSENAVTGIGCNNGTVTGTARVVMSLEQIDRIQPGDILITKFTDTGWTSKFAVLKGIVTEYGGLLCPAAVVSREYGIPCIVCAKNITKKIKDGSTVRINGSSGEITVIS